ncbi:hypothetical protein FA041_11640 [Escherichia coli]|nr:hypothetical protein [Escherichia coli]MBW9312809.1 hypothetical protein [Escherichia coli]
MRTKDNMTGQSSALSLHTCSASRGLMLVAIISIALFHAGLKLLMVFVVVCVLKNTMGRFIHFRRCLFNFRNSDNRKTGGAANRIAATATKDPVTGWIFYEATIEAVEGETLIGAMIQYAPKKVV